MNPRMFLAWLLVLATFTISAAPTLAIDDAHFKKADAAVKRGIAFLRKTQAEDGSWTAQPGPAITALALRAMLEDPDTKADDPAVTKAIEYILGKVRPDGGIHGGMLENYNTAICLSALAKVNNRPGASEAIKKAQDYLRGLQWAGQQDPHGKTIDESHAFFGGAGYGKDGRPDMSNTQIMLEGLYDSGLDCNDPAFQRALVFITRCQGTAANKEFGDKIARDGGFVYATSQSKDKIGVVESKAGEESIDGAARARTYGSMTYAGFKSYVYAQLDRNDPRVTDALTWIRKHYTLDENPGMPELAKHQGLYYYYMTFSRALDAWGEPTLTTADGQKRDWANDLIDKVTSLQREDGSWVNDADRWMEGDPNLVTAYSLIALQHAMR
jgi:squalene-hopene/tetraprenyl-beta-curcumene cyclase